MKRSLLILVGLLIVCLSLIGQTREETKWVGRSPKVVFSGFESSQEVVEDLYEVTGMVKSLTVPTEESDLYSTGYLYAEIGSFVLRAPVVSVRDSAAFALLSLALETELPVRVRYAKDNNPTALASERGSIVFVQLLSVSKPGRDR